MQPFLWVALKRQLWLKFWLKVVQRIFSYLAGHWFSRRGCHLSTNFALTTSTFCFDDDVLIFAHSHL